MESDRRVSPPASFASAGRHQRLLSGASIIKSYVHESELRREASRFNNAPVSLYAKPPHFVEHAERDIQHQTSGKQDALRLPAKPSTAPEAQSYRLRQHGDRSSRSSSSNNQRDEEEQHETHGERSVTAPSTYEATGAPQKPLAAFFAGKSVHRARRLSISAAHAAQVSAAANSNSNNGNPSVPGAAAPVKPVAVVKRKLQMESVVYRNTSTAVLAVPLRGRNNNLSAKLDAVVKASPWMRRKVVVNDENRPGGRGAKQFSPHHGSTLTASTTNSHPHSATNTLPPTNTNNNNAASKDIPQYELERKVMAAFSRIVRMWRERKRRSEAKTLTMMNGNKLRKDNGIQSAHVVGILSRRMIREVPALQFFDVEPESVGGSNDALASAATMALSHNTPRGVCYTLDANGCRCIKMESGALQNSCTGQRERHKKREEVTIEKAMGKTLRRKMVKRVKAKRSGILKLTDDFHKSRQDLAFKLDSQLALHQAEGEKMFSKRLALLLTNDTSLPAYQAQKEFYLARVRCRKADLLEKCQTLHALSELLQLVEAEGERSGLDISLGELHFLDLFRCVVEEDKVLTPLISDGIQQQLSARDQQSLIVTELMTILQREVDK